MIVAGALFLLFILIILSFVRNIAIKPIKLEKQKKEYNKLIKLHKEKIKLVSEKYPKAKLLIDGATTYHYSLVLKFKPNYNRDGKIESYPIKEIKRSLGNLKEEYPKAFIQEERNRKLRQLNI